MGRKTGIEKLLLPANSRHIVKLLNSQPEVQRHSKFGHPYTFKRILLKNERHRIYITLISKR